MGWTGEVGFYETAGSGEDTLGPESTTEAAEHHETSGSDEDTKSLDSINEEGWVSETSGSDKSLPPENNLRDEGLIEYCNKEGLERQLYHAGLKTVPI